MKDMELFRAFVLRVLGRPLDAAPPVWLSGWEVVEALWPLNERFHGAQRSPAALCRAPLPNPFPLH